MSPGDPIERILGEDATVEEIEKVRSDLGLDKPLIVQYKKYLEGCLTLDLGKSLYKKKEITQLIKSNISPTMIIAFSAIFLAMIWGIPMGVWVSINKSSYIDDFGRLLSLSIFAFPIFSLAPLLVIIFSIHLDLLPVSEWGSIKHAILPIFTLALPLGAVLMRVTRNKFLEENKAQWVTVLYSKGLSKTSIVLRIVKISLPTILNIVAIQLSVVLAGTMVTETIFDIPGMGSLMFEGIQNRDYPLVQGVILYTTTIYMAVYFLFDFINKYIDPRLANE